AEDREADLGDVGSVDRRERGVDRGPRDRARARREDGVGGVEDDEGVVDAVARGVDGRELGAGDTEDAAREGGSIEGDLDVSDLAVGELLDSRLDGAVDVQRELRGRGERETGDTDDGERDGETLAAVVLLLR